MAGITLADAQAKLALWLAAETAVAAGQSYEIDAGNGSRRKLQRVDLNAIRQAIEYWDQKVKDLTVSNAGGRTRYFVFDHD